jgi:hypothetical protein
MPLQLADVLEFESTPSKSIRAKIEIFDSPPWDDFIPTLADSCL